MKGATKAEFIGNILPFVSSLVLIRGHESLAEYLINGLWGSLIVDVNGLRTAIPTHCLGAALVQPLMVALIRTMGYKIGLSVAGVFNVFTLILVLSLNVMGIDVVILLMFLSGVSVGSTYISLMSYFAEISQPKDRPGRVIMVIGIFAFGNVMNSLMSQFLSTTVITIIYTLLGVGFVLLALTLLPESPYFLQRKKKPNVEETIRLLKGSACTHEDIQEIEDVLQTNIGNSCKVYAGPIIAIISQFVGYEYYKDVILSTLFLQKPIVTYLVILVGVVVSAVVVMFTRKTEIVIVSCLATLILHIMFVATGILVNIDVQLAANFFIFFHAIGLRCIPLLLLIEIFPLNSKPVTLAMYSTFVGLIPFIYQVIYVSDSATILSNEMHYVYMVMICLCLILLVFVPNTKGRTLGEIQKQLSANK